MGFEPEYIAVVISVVVAPFLFWLGRSLFRWWKRSRLFRLGFVPRWPPASDDKLHFYKAIPIAAQDINVGVIVRAPISMERFDFRLVKTRRGKGTVAPSDIEITQINPHIRRSFDEVISGRDIPGGIEARYTQPDKTREKEILYFKLHIDARKEWQGYLSFRSYDERGRPCFSRCKLIASEIMRPTPAPDMAPPQT